MSLDVWLSKPMPTDVFTGNCTHNLSQMAEAAGLYRPCWRPDVLGVTKAGELIPLLQAGLEQLKSDPEHFKTFTPANKWGSYESLVSFVEGYLQACITHPDATVQVGR